MAKSHATSKQSSKCKALLVIYSLPGSSNALECMQSVSNYKDMRSSIRYKLRIHREDRGRIPSK